MKRSNPQMHKLSHAVADDWLPYSHPPVYCIEPASQATRLVVGMPGGDSMPFAQLVACLEAPYLLLYVLHTPRGEAEAGRYESGEVSTEQFQAFMARFGDYLSSDARFDLWAYCASERATVVWDRHDQLFAYGPIDKFAATLNALGFHQGEAGIPSPHQHHYRREFDADAAALLSYFAWTRSSLREEDGQ